MLAAGLVLQGRYRLERALGRGGMGAVYLATDQTFGSTVAIKQTLCEGADLEKAFQREARLLNSLRHAALPVVIDYFSDAHGQFLVMQYIPGDDVGVLLDGRGEPFPPAQVADWADQLLDALQYLHEHDPQVIHRDIKPRNLKLTPRGEVVLLDFGLSKSTPVESRVTGTSVSVLGYTPHYAPFEQIQGQGTDPRSDLFALAATLYHLLTRVLPPDAMVRALTTMNGQADPLRPAHVVNPDVPVALASVVHEAMAMGRDQRPASAAAMRSALRAAAPGDARATVVPAAAATVALPSVAAPARGEAAVTAARDAAATGARPSGAVPAPGGAAATAAAAPAGRGGRGWTAAAGALALTVAIGLALGLPARRADRPRLATDADGAAAAAGAASGVAGHDLPTVITVPPAERTFAFQTVAVGADGGVIRRDLREARFYEEDLGNGLTIEMVAIPGGRFVMGDATGTYPDEQPQRTVAIAPFYLGRYEVTRAQWRAVAALPRVRHDLPSDPAGTGEDELPVALVSWEEAMEFAARVRWRARRLYRLPSEAEWEYAGRAGTTTPFALGETLTPALASYDPSVSFQQEPRGTPPARPSAVGSFGVANAFGLFDVHGNVAEWCLGEYHPSYEGAPEDGRPWVRGGDADRHVVRGGSWRDLAVDCRSANRYAYPRTGRQPTIGLRLAMSIGSDGPMNAAEAAPPASPPPAREAALPPGTAPAPRARR